MRRQLAAYEFRLQNMAIEAYLESPNTNPLVVEILYKALGRNLKPLAILEKFNPKSAIQIASAMLENGIQSAPVYYAAFQGFYAIQKFDQAQEMLDKLKALQPNLDPSLQERLTVTKKIGYRNPPSDNRRLSGTTSRLYKLKPPMARSRLSCSKTTRQIQLRTSLV